MQLQCVVYSRPLHTTDSIFWVPPPLLCNNYLITFNHVSHSSCVYCNSSMYVVYSRPLHTTDSIGWAPPPLLCNNSLTAVKYVPHTCCVYCNYCVWFTIYLYILQTLLGGFHLLFGVIIILSLLNMSHVNQLCLLQLQYVVYSRPLRITNSIGQIPSHLWCNM